MRLINCCYRTSVRTCVESLVADLRLALLISQGRKCFQNKMGTLRERDKSKSGMTLSIFNAVVSWAKNYLATTSELAKCSTPVALEPMVLQELSEVAQEGFEIATALRSGYNFLGTLFHLDKVRIDEHNSLVDLCSWVKLRLDRLPDLREWLDVENTIAELRNLGLEEFFRESLKKKVEAKALPAAFEKQFLRSWIDEVCGHDPALNSFSGTLHEQAIDEFRKLDKQLVQITPQRVILQLQSRRPDLLFTSQRSPDIGILQGEIHKKKSHKTLRRLFAEIPDLIQALKPCFLMSPMSVSSYMVPGKMKFDVLLFDEASQIMPADAIGSILRSPQVIVVGDTKQLPPTRFFAAIEDDDRDDEESLEETPLEKSIMEEALGAGLREKTLLWHYRSRDESLIAFSNYYFYNRALITFPSAGTHAFPIGIEFVLVPNAAYDRSRSRTNRREAERVAELVYQHYKQSPNHSLGVVAFSLPQADAIDAAVEVLRKKDEGFDEWCNTDSPEHFFIKNLENVQGDERDVMFLSVGYGPDELGQITMNFGPLNHEDGQRRLNVAITRAREHVKLISSFDPSQIDLSRVRKEGVRLLKEYMEIAKHGVDAIPRAIRLGPGESESRFEEEVYEALRAKGLQLRKQIGVSGYRIDLGVVDPNKPGRFLLGIECDGATYHSFKTARDRDRLRQQVLENLGWKIHRIWSRDWVQNRQREIDRVLAVLK
jgi:very-short-patch-repair endonuclease